MQDLLAALQAAPFWAQVGMAFFALTFLAMVIEPQVGHRRARRRFAALAAARGAAITPGYDAFAASFAIADAGRSFTVTRELRVGSRSTSYRGPRGHLLIVETPLAGSRWTSHGVDIAQRGSLAKALSSPMKSGDTVFDDRFTVWQDGVPVRDGWLDEAARRAVTALFDLPALAGDGTLWVQEGRLQFLCDRPKAIDDAALTALVAALASVAAQFERTAGWRGPAV